MEVLNRVRCEEAGVSLVEEGFLVLLIALACFGAVAVVGTNVAQFFTSFAPRLTGAA